MCTFAASAGHIFLNAQPILETHRLQFQIIRNNLQFLRERNHFVRPGTQGIAQRIGEPRHGALRPAGIIGDERAHRIERIEKKMRIELRLEQTQFRQL